MVSEDPPGCVWAVIVKQYFSLLFLKMASESEQQQQQLHFILFPHMAQGHMIPMIDIARLLAQNGVIITLITTPINANRFKQTLDRAAESGLRINCIQLEFPAEEAGLPKNCENLDLLTSLGQATDFACAINELLQQPAEELLENIKPSPNCIISDITLYYTSHLAAKFHLPRIVFTGFSCFSMLCMHRLASSGVLETVESESEYFSVPGMPDSVEFTKQQLSGAAIRNPGKLVDEIVAAEKLTYGIIMNSFEELEPEYVQEYTKVRGDKVWCIGPVSLNNKDNSDLIQRGDNVSIRESDECLKWLDEQQSGSVIYVCFGSICNLVTLQLIELALGLEASNRPFVWVIRGGEKSVELEKWMEEERFEERTKGRSLIIKGWAPQLVILSHVAIGGFLTHCGWNSVLEGISVGVPMITWPLFLDQFYNEKLAVDVLKIGVKVGAKESVVWGEEEKIGVVVKREDVGKAIAKVFDVGEEGEEVRRKVKELSLKAKRAMEEDGSSYLNLKLLIEEIKVLASILSESIML